MLLFLIILRHNCTWALHAALARLADWVGTEDLRTHYMSTCDTAFQTHTAEAGVWHRREGLMVRVFFALIEAAITYRTARRRFRGHWMAAVFFTLNTLACHHLILKGEEIITNKTNIVFYFILGAVALNIYNKNWENGFFWRHSPQ